MSCDDYHPDLLVLSRDVAIVDILSLLSLFQTYDSINFTMTAAVFNDYEILVGTYEEYVIGFKLTAQIKSSTKYDLTQNFTVKAHVGPVRCITTGSKYAISGGSDEQCKIFDLDKRVEHGVLAHHDGTVSCVTTHSPTSHLLTASDDNSIRLVIDNNTTQVTNSRCRLQCPHSGQMLGKESFKFLVLEFFRIR